MKKTLTSLAISLGLATLGTIALSAPAVSATLVHAGKAFTGTSDKLKR